MALNVTGSGNFGVTKVIVESCVFTFYEKKKSDIVGSPYQEKNSDGKIR